MNVTPSQLGRILYEEYVNSLDPKVKYSMPDFNRGLDEYIRKFSDDPLVFDSALDAKINHMWR